MLFALSLITLLTSPIVNTLPILPFSNITSSTPLASLPMTRRIVYDQHIINPAADDVWKIGTWVEVAWDTKGLPTESKVEGKIVLGHIQDGSTNEHLNNDQPLASGFPLSAGSTKVYVPDVPPRDDYIVNLFGDSGNISERFTISL